MRYILFALICLFPLLLQANEDNGKLGVYTAYEIHWANADITGLDGVHSCCPLYTDGRGTGFNIGMYYQQALDFADLQLRIGLLTQNSKLSQIENIPLALNDGELNGQFEHTLDANVYVLNLTPTLKYHLYDRLNSHIGIALGYRISSNYEQKEVIINPSDRGVFKDTKTRVRNRSEGSIPEIQHFYSALKIGLAYELNFSKNNPLTLVPEIQYSIPFSSIVSSGSWNVSTLSIGFSVKFNHTKRIPNVKINREKIREIRKNKNKKKIEDMIAVSVSAVELVDNKEVPQQAIVVEEFETNESYPLLNYIFFEENSYQIPKRYRLLSHIEKNVFKIDTLKAESSLDIYHHILNIIAVKMRDDINSNIQLMGYNAGSGIEKNNKNLSMQRAEAIKSYLVSWGIDANRININAKNLPAQASSTKNRQGIAENRRVEISSNNPQLLASISLSDKKYKVYAEGLRFYNNVKTGSDIKNWDLKILNKNYPIKEFSGHGDLPNTIDWTIKNNRKTISKINDTLQYVLSVKNQNEAVSSEPGKIPVELKTIDLKRQSDKQDIVVDRFSLILFGFDDASISPENKLIIEQIKLHIKPASKVFITGYSDSYGDASYNKELARNRAINVAKVIDYVNTFAEGKTGHYLFGDSLPEERFYSRTVEIVIETPVK